MKQNTELSLWDLFQNLFLCICDWYLRLFNKKRIKFPCGFSTNFCKGFHSKVSNYLYRDVLCKRVSNNFWNLLNQSSVSLECISCFNLANKFCPILLWIISLVFGLSIIKVLPFLHFSGTIGNEVSKSLQKIAELVLRGIWLICRCVSFQLTATDSRANARANTTHLTWTRVFTPNFWVWWLRLRSTHNYYTFST